MMVVAAVGVSLSQNGEAFVFFLAAVSSSVLRIPSCRGSRAGAGEGPWVLARVVCELMSRQIWRSRFFCPLWVEESIESLASADAEL